VKKYEHRLMFVSGVTNSTRSNKYEENALLMNVRKTNANTTNTVVTDGTIFFTNPNIRPF
jgi:hypothetical protein